VDTNWFALFAHGKAFDVDGYLAKTTLRFDEVWHAGETHPKSNGVRKVLGDGTVLSLPEQQRVAIEYLTTHRKALRALRRFPGVTTFILGVQFRIEVDTSAVGFSMGHSVPLLRAALDVGAEPTFYVSLERRGGGLSSERPQSPTRP
jgi:hypothetical protein